MKTVLSTSYTLIIGVAVYFLSTFVAGWMIPMSWGGIVVSIVVVCFIGSHTNFIHALMLRPYTCIVGNRTAVKTSMFLYVMLFFLISAYILWRCWGDEGHWIIGSVCGIVIAYDILVTSAIGMSVFVTEE